jgi:hypothetical protein
MNQQDSRNAALSIGNKSLEKVQRKYVNISSYSVEKLLELFIPSN